MRKIAGTFSTKRTEIHDVNARLTITPQSLRSMRKQHQYYGRSCSHTYITCDSKSAELYWIC